MNVDGSEITQITTDGGTKNDLQWLPDGDTLIFISGLTVKSYNVETDVVDNVTNFPSASSLNAFRVSNDGKQVMIAVNNEIFVVPFDIEIMKGVARKVICLRWITALSQRGEPNPRSIVKEARWAHDDKLVAWLFKGPHGHRPGERLEYSGLHACQDRHSRHFPGNRFNPPGSRAA